MRALIGVYDKTGIEEFARGLHGLGWELVSTGGHAPRDRGGGRAGHGHRGGHGLPGDARRAVKTLHPAVHAGILARRDLPEHGEALAGHGFGTIDLVACNLYPFRAVVTKEGGASLADGIENIDIGGPTMLRAAAKNHADVVVLADPADYAPTLEALAGEGLDAGARRRLAWKAFQHVASYDSAVAEWLWDGDTPPPSLSVPLERVAGLRYGENPHQGAAFYRDGSLGEESLGGIATAAQHHGKELSYNNYPRRRRRLERGQRLPRAGLRDREAHEPLRGGHARRPPRGLPAGGGGRPGKARSAESSPSTGRSTRRSRGSCANSATRRTGQRACSTRS